MSALLKRRATHSMVVSDPLVYPYCTQAGNFLPVMPDMTVPFLPNLVAQGQQLGLCMHVFSTICGHVDCGIVHAGMSQMGSSYTRVIPVVIMVGGRPLLLELTAKEPRIF